MKHIVTAAMAFMNVLSLVVCCASVRKSCATWMEMPVSRCVVRVNTVWTTIPAFDFQVSASSSRASARRHQTCSREFIARLNFCSSSLSGTSALVLSESCSISRTSSYSPARKSANFGICQLARIDFTMRRAHVVVVSDPDMQPHELIRPALNPAVHLRDFGRRLRRRRRRCRN